MLYLLALYLAMLNLFTKGMDQMETLYTMSGVTKRSSGRENDPFSETTSIQ